MFFSGLLPRDTYFGSVFLTATVKGGVMKKQNDIKRGLVTRRDFVRAVSLSVGALAVGPQGVAMSAFGKNVYPAQKITCIVSNPAGGGYDTIARGIAPFLSKHLRKLSPQAKGGGLVIKNEPPSSWKACSYPSLS